MNHDGTLTKNEILKRLKTADDRLLKRFSSVLQLPQNLKRLDGSLNKFENMWKKMDVDDDKEVTLKCPPGQQVEHVVLPWLLQLQCSR